MGTHHMYCVHSSKVPMRPTPEIREAEIFKNLDFLLIK